VSHAVTLIVSDDDGGVTMLSIVFDVR